MEKLELLEWGLKELTHDVRLIKRDLRRKSFHEDGSQRHSGGAGRDEAQA